MRRILEHLACLPNPDEHEPWELAYEHASLLYDLSTEILRAGFPDDTAEDGPAIELAYLDVPFELVPVAWNGGDGLHYDWVVHAPELDAPDFPMVSFAPGEEGAVWLGDATAEGLGHLLVGRRKDRLAQGLEDPRGTPSWETLVRLIGLAPDPDEPRIGAGARSQISCVPPVPDGYRFEDGPDGVGVLAPAACFGIDDFEAVEGDEVLFRREARRLAAAGHHAGALVLLKNLRAWTPDDLDVVRRMRDAYLALGRPMHARRTEIWLSRRAT